MRHLWIVLLLGCGDTQSDKGTDAPTEESIEETESSTLEETVVGEGDIEPAETAESRIRMRMNIDQLQASMKHITGVDWMSGNKLLWDEFRTSLGVPDYQETVSEDLTANVIFQKFLQDAATYSCQQWREHDGSAVPMLSLMMRMMRQSQKRWLITYDTCADWCMDTLPRLKTP